MDKPTIQPKEALLGLFFDAKGKLALALLTEEVVGVTVNRFEAVPDDFEDCIWLVIGREGQEGNIEMFLVGDGQSRPYSLDEISSPQAREAAQFAIEVALKAWPDWCAHLRQVFEPKWPISVLPQGPSAEA